MPTCPVCGNRCESTDCPTCGYDILNEDVDKRNAAISRYRHEQYRKAMAAAQMAAESSTQKGGTRYIGGDAPNAGGTMDFDQNAERQRRELEAREAERRRRELEARQEAERKRRELEAKLAEEKRRREIALKQAEERKRLEKMRQPAPEPKPKKKSKKKLVIPLVILAVLIAVAAVAFILLDGSMIKTGNKEYRFFGSLEELLNTERSIIVRIDRGRFTVTCEDYIIESADGIDDSISGVTRYVEGCIETSDRFMPQELVITDKDSGHRYIFEVAADAETWVENGYRESRADRNDPSEDIEPEDEPKDDRPSSSNGSSSVSHSGANDGNAYNDSLSASQREAIIATIQEQFSNTQNRIDADGESQKAGTNGVVYYLDGELVIYKELPGTTTEAEDVYDDLANCVEYYYYDGDEVYFIFLHNTENGHAYRLYFSNGHLIRWRDPDGNAYDHGEGIWDILQAYYDYGLSQCRKYA